MYLVIQGVERQCQGKQQHACYVLGGEIKDGSSYHKRNNGRSVSSATYYTLIYSRPIWLGDKVQRRSRCLARLQLLEINYANTKIDLQPARLLLLTW